MRSWGLLLLVVGFASFLALVFWFHATDWAIFSQAYDSLPQQQTFSRSDVLQRLDALFRRLQHHPAWLLIPAVLMLSGGLLLRRRP
jgi:hypothetical protein